MIEYGLPALFALFVWWFSTGVIIYLDGLPRHTFRWSMLGATVLLAASIYGLAETKDDTTLSGAYWAFTFGLLAWGWQEISFYMGFVTGPRKQACPEGCSGWRHFGHAIQTTLYHELAIIAGAIVVVAITWGGANQIGTWTFLILWGMHQSAKLNVFLGVRNLNEEFLPEHMAFLKGFLTKKPMNLLFPVSITVSTVILAWLVQLAMAPEASAFETVGYTFLATMMALAVLEHWFLVLPLPVASLWNWSLSSHRKEATFRMVEESSPAQLTDSPDLNFPENGKSKTGHQHDHDDAHDNRERSPCATGEAALGRSAMEASIAACIVPDSPAQNIESQSEKETKNGLPELLRPAAY